MGISDGGWGDINPFTPSISNLVNGFEDSFVPTISLG